MRFVLRLLLMFAVALGVGFGLSFYALNDGRLFGVQQIGVWSAWPDIGSSQPNPYTRAHIARDAALQLGRAEGIQFVASTDSEGEPLDLDCAYRLTGHLPISTFWTLAAVDSAWVNLAAPGTEPVIRSSEVIRLADGGIAVNVGRNLAPGTWLELAGSGPFSLVINLYDSTVFSGFGSGGDSMPLITRGACT